VAAADPGARQLSAPLELRPPVIPSVQGMPLEAVGEDDSPQGPGGEWRSAPMLFDVHAAFNNSDSAGPDTDELLELRSGVATLDDANPARPARDPTVVRAVVWASRFAPPAGVGPARAGMAVPAVSVQGRVAGPSNDASASPPEGGATGFLRKLSARAVARAGRPASPALSPEPSTTALGGSADPSSLGMAAMGQRAGRPVAEGSEREGNAAR
jgi:hypothetical protein